jgi:glutamate--cysteine ligase
LYADYSSVQGYVQSIGKMVSDGILSSHKELYAPVRLKFVKTSDHISYIELRFIDIDPMVKAGITEDALHFLHSLALYGLLTEEPDSFGIREQEKANNYLEYVALNGLNATPFIHEQSGESIDIQAEIKQHIQAMSALFIKLLIDKPEYFEVIGHINELIENPGQRGVYEVLAGITKSGYIPFHLKQAQTFLKQSQLKNYNFNGLEDMELSTQLLLREAVKRGVSFEILDRKENFIRFSQNENIQYIKQATKTSLDNYACILAMENKLVTKKILNEAGIRVPKGMEYTEPGKAKSDYLFFKGKPVVVKPNQTNFGIGISILKENKDMNVFERAVDIAFEHDSTILIEEFIEGKEFSFFVIADEVAAILHRVPANVTGDGTLSIQELIQLKNQDPLRGKGYHTPLEKIQTGEAESMFLASQQKNFDYIPSDGEIVFLRENSNISTGGDSIDFTDGIPDSYKQLAIQAAKAMNVKITGLDMIIQDYKQDANFDNYAIIEMNFNPAIHIHCHPFKGKNRKLYEKIMDLLGYNH